MKSRWREALTTHLQTPFVAGLLILMAAMFWLSRTFSLGAKLFPMVVAGAGMLLALLELLRQWRSRGAREEQDFSDLAGDDDASTYPQGLLHLGWVAGFLVLFLAIGALPATGLYVVSFLRFRHNVSWWTCSGIAAGLMLVLWALGLVLRLKWPEPWLF
jgi:hypothetical protein